MAPKVGMVSLGCPKALVDSERIITQLRSEGYQLAPDYEGADAVIVNTCGFVDSAKQESLDAITEALDENGKDRVIRIWFKSKLNVLYNETWWTYSTGLGME